MIKSKQSELAKLIFVMLFLVVFSLSGSATCLAASVLFHWDPATDAAVTGYKVYYRTDSAAQPFQGTGAAQGASPIDVHAATSITLSGLDQSHVYFFAVTAYNAAGEESVYSETVSAFDTTAPSVSIVSPTNNTLVAGTVPVYTTAYDNVAVAKVEFYVNGVYQSTNRNAASPYLFYWNSSTLDTGTYLLSAMAYDEAGNIGTSASVAVNIIKDIINPVASITSPANNATVSRTVIVTAVATDNKGLNTLTIYENGSPLAVGNVSPLSVSWDTTAVANGTYTLLAKAYDTSGNIGISSNVVVTVDNGTSSGSSVNYALASNGGVATASSTLAGNYPASSVINGDRKGLNWGAGGGWADATPNVYPDWVQITFNGQKTITEVDVFSVQDNYTSPVEPTSTLTFTKYGLASFTVQYWNGTSWVTVPGGSITGNNLVWRRISFSAITTNQIRVQVYSVPDGYSRITEIEAYGAVIDTTAPVTAISSPTSGSAVSGTVAVTASASDNVGVSRVEFYVNSVLQTTVTSSPYTFSWDTTSVANGSYTLVANAYDASGNVGTSPDIVVTVNNAAPITPSGPSVNYALASNGGVATASSTLAGNYPASSVINGDRKGLNWGAGGGWADATPNIYPDWVQITFNGQKTITEVDVFSVQDNYTSPVEPTSTLTFTKYGLTSFTVQYWNGTSWVTVPGGSITGNNLVWRKISFSAITTNQIRVQVYSVPDGYSRITEIEAYGASSAPVTDTTAPTVSLTTPSSGSTVSGTVAVTASATDNVGVSRVEFYVNSVLQSTVTSSPYTYNWNSTLLANGSCILSAKAYDAAGNVGTSSDITVTTNNDKVSPTVSLTSPSSGSTVSGTVAVTASANDNVGVNRVEFYVNSILQATVTSSPYTFSWNTALLANGSYILSATAYDAAGNAGASSNVTVTASNDKTAPTVSLATPFGGSTVSGTVAVTATATDNVGVNRVEFYVNSVLKTTVTSSPYTYSWNTTSLTNGFYTLSAKAYDVAGNAGTSSNITVTVNNDPIAPTVSLSAPSNGVTVGGTVAVTASATDNVSVSRVEFYVNSILQATITSSPYTFSWNTALVANGIYTLVAKAYDAVGNVGTSPSIVVTVNSGTGSSSSVNYALASNGGVATASSTLAGNYPASSVINGDRKGLNWGAGGGWADATPNVYPDWVQITFNGQKTITEVDVFSVQDNYTSPVEPTSTLTFTKYGLTSFTVQYWNGTSWVTVPGGSITGNNLVWRKISFSAITTNQIRVQVYSVPDGYSRITEIEAYGASSAPVTDTTAPTVSLTTPSSGSTVSGTVAVTASATDNVGVNRVEFYVDSILQSTVTSSPYTFSWNTAALTNGFHILSAKVYDAAGNVGSSSSVTVTTNNDQIAPTVYLSNPADGSTVSGTVDITANAIDNVGVSKVEFYVNNVLQATVTTSPYTYSWNTTLLANGSYTLFAKAYDASGNVGTSSSVTVNIDPTAPIVLLSAPSNGAAVSGTVAVTASATDNVGVSRVEFYVNNVLQTTVTSSPYTYSWNTGFFTNGSYTLIAKAYDVAGNVGTSPSVVVTVNNTSQTVNVALASNGGVATASSTYVGNYPASSVINGDRKGLNWGAGGGWADATPDIYPDWVQITFNGQKTITEVDVFSVQDDFANPVEPTAALTFTLYGLTSFDVQYWDGTSWVTVPGGSINDNNSVWRKINFPAITTNKIRVQVNWVPDGCSRITEIEAY